MVKAIVGANWGDEGKGKITDVLADNSDIVIRFQGGANAGHTIINDYGKFALHQLPSGVFHQNITNIIGNGVAFSVENFVKEMQELRDRGVPEPQVIISDRAQIVMPYHVAFDCYEEERLGKNSFGSTKSGIAPFYSDKYSKIGFQINELYDDPDSLKAKIHHALEIKNAILENLYNKPAISEQEVFDKLMEYKELLAPYVGDAFMFLHNAIKEGKSILLEGQLGSLKDTDFGIYPMVTSSNTAQVFLPMKSRRSSRSLRRIPARSARASSSPKSLATRQTSCADAAATAVSSARQPADPVVWAGWIWLPPVTAAWCRARHRLRSPCSMYSAISTKSPYASAMSSTVR